MKIQYVSDLHTEGWVGYENYFPKIDSDTDVLVVAGDACTHHSMGFFMQWVKSVEIPVVYVPGNHEYYRASLKDIDIILKMVQQDIPNLNVLLSETVEIEGVTFIGTTLWTELNNPLQEMYLVRSMRDFHVISDMSLDVWKSMFEKQRDYLSHALYNTRGKQRVVVTHHSPSLRSIAPKWEGSSINLGFHSDLDYLIEKEQPVAWIHGHTHDSMDYKIGETRVVCNPRGYTGENFEQGSTEYIAKELII